MTIIVESHVRVCHIGELCDSLSWWGVTWQALEEETGDTTSIVGKWREMNSCCFVPLLLCFYIVWDPSTQDDMAYIRGKSSHFN